MLILALMFLPQLLYAQIERGERPKIGYVFSGGGAKGLALPPDKPDISQTGRRQFLIQF